MTAPRIVDSHCHLDFDTFADELDAVVERAASAGVDRMLTICTKVENIEKSAEIAARFNNVWFAAGIHPHYAASQASVSPEQLAKFAKHPKMIAIGETGLDYYYTKESESEQKRSLESHIEAARLTKLPLIIHSRSADKDMGAILEREFKAGPFDCVMHCYSSGPELAELALDLGFFLSISGIATFKNAEDLREIFRSAPKARILVETDAPYLAPQPYRGKRNEPAYAAITARLSAEFLDMGYGEFATQTSANFDRLFSKAI
ncbi:MAG: TatD family hydrolase [Albidovulum sp.]|nr:TatD family hydrolase [Albidovulum sp.]